MTQELSDKLFFEGISSLGLKPAVLEAIVDIHKIVYSENSLNEGVQTVECFVAEFNNPEEAMEQEYNFRSAHGHQYDSFHVGNKVAVYPTECREKVEEFLGKPVVTKSVIHPWAGTTQLDSVLNEGVLNEGVLNEGVLGTLAKLGLGIGAGVILLTGGQALERSNITHKPFPSSLAHVVGADAGYIVNAAKSVKDSVLGVGDAVVDIGKDVEKGYNKTNPSKPAPAKNAPQKPIKRVAGK